MLKKVQLLVVPLLLCCLMGLPARGANGQEVLETKITLRVDDVKLKTALRRIEEKAQIKFVFSSNVIQANEKISLNAVEKTLRAVLDEIMPSRSIEYKVLGGRILLQKREVGTGMIVRPPVLSPTAAPTLPTAVTAAAFIITGRITNEPGEPLAGVSIALIGSTKGTVSDTTGAFRLEVTDDDKNGTLSFTLVGHERLSVPINGQKTMNIIMRESGALSELVVVGYGEKSKKKLTTAISSIKAESVNELPVGTLGDALAGAAAGLQVSSGFGGMPGESPTVRIRGIGSLGADNAPLYVVDGYPLQSEGNFASIDPADIESIEVLKDAASASIYGSRAANGVIIVTTKRGKDAKTRFSVSSIAGWQQIAKKVDVLSRDEFNEYIPLLRGIKYRILDSLRQYEGTDWQDAIFDNKSYNEIKLSAAGGSEKAKFVISAGHLNQPGVLLGTGAKRYTLRVNFDGELTKFLKTGFSLAPSYVEQDRRPNGGNFNTSGDGEYGVVVPSPIYTALLISPALPLRLPDGRYAQPNFLRGNDLFNTGIYNPVAVLENLTNHNTNFRNLGNAYLEWTPAKGLKYKLNAGGTLDFNRRQVYVSPFAPTTSSSTASFLTPNYNVIYAGDTKGRNIDWLIENTLTYGTAWGKKKQHNFKALLLQSAQKYSSSVGTVFGRTGSFTSTQITNPSASADRGGDVSYDIFTFYSLGGRLSYDFKGKYLLDASIRRDGSSKFGANRKFGIFPSVAFAWRVYDESWLKGVRWLSDLKFRASYGETGNANIGSFSWQNFLRGSNYNFGINRQFGTLPAGFYNPDLTWEKNKQFDLGVDVAFFKDRLALTVDVYNKNTFDMILNKQLPGIVGYTPTFNTNAGNLQNRGIELTLTTRNVKTRHFNWTTEINFSRNRNLVTDLGGAENLGFYNAVTGWNNAFLIQVGSPIGDMYGYQVDGIIRDAEEAAAVPKYGVGTVLPAPGDMKIRDINADGVIDQKDITKIGNSQADFIAGMTNRITFRNFDLSFVIQGQQGGNIINGLFRNPWGTPGANLPRDMYRNIFIDKDPLGDNARVKYPAVTSRAPILFTNSLTNLAIYDASFLRLRNVTFGFKLPSALTRKLRIQSTRFYVSGQNLFTLSTYPGYNPEVSLNGNSVTQPGVDQGVYPQVKTMIAGLNLSF